MINRKLKTKVPIFKDMPILISGGTNSFTGNLARQLNVNFNGITIGTHARKIISSFRNTPKNIDNQSLLSAITKAKNLIDNNLFG